MYSLLQLTRLAIRDDDVPTENLDMADSWIKKSNLWKTCADVVSYACSVACNESGLDEAAVRDHLGMPDSDPDFDVKSLGETHKEMLDKILKAWRDGMAKVAA